MALLLPHGDLGGMSGLTAAYGYRQLWEAGDANGVLVHVLLAHEAMTAQGQSVVARDDDVGVFQTSVGSQLLDDTPHLFVDVVDHCIING